MKRNRFTVALILVGAAVRGSGQTAVDLSRQGKLGAGTVLPPKCAVGQVFLKTDAPVGANLYACTTTDGWVPMGVLNISGDVSGPQASATVQGLQGRGVSNAAPADRNVLRWNSVTSKWEPGVVPSTGTAAPPPTCTTGTFYLQNDVSNNIHQLYVCSDNNWANASLRSGPAAMRPAGCVIGQTWLATDSAALTYCSASGTPGTWSALAGSGGGSSNPSTGPTNSVQAADGSGGFVGYSGLTLDSSKIAATVPVQLPGLFSTVDGSSNQGNDANYHRAWNLNYISSGEGLNFGFPTDKAFGIDATFKRGFNDDVITGGSSKLTAAGLTVNVESPAAGQRFGIGGSLNCWGMGDCFGGGYYVTSNGGCNDQGCEGAGLSRDSFQQGTHANATIVAVPAQSQCTGTITQDVTTSVAGASQAVTFTKTSGAGTCLNGEWIDIDRGVIYNDQNHEVTQLTADYSSGHITAVFGSLHANGAAVVPATVIRIDNLYTMGEMRPLIITSGGASHTGTIGSISDRTLTVNDTVSAGVVGGDATLPCFLYFRQDDYSGPPINSGTNPLHAAFACTGIPNSTTVLFGHKDAAGSAPYTGTAAAGGDYVLAPGSRIRRIFGDGTVILEANSFTWTVGQTVQCPVSTDVVVSQTHRFSEYTPSGTWYTSLGIDNGGARKGQAAFTITSTMVGQTATLAGSINNSVTTIALSNANAATGSIIKADSEQMLVTAGGSTTPTVTRGVQGTTAAPHSSGATVYLDNADHTAFATALNINAPSDIGISIGSTDVAGIHFDGYNADIKNQDIRWGNDNRIGIHGNTLSPGMLGISAGDGGPGPVRVQFGNRTALGNNGDFGVMAANANIYSLIDSGATGTQFLGLLRDQGVPGNVNGWRIETITRSQGPLRFRYINQLGAEDYYPFDVYSNGPVLPSTGTAASGTNYGSSKLTFNTNTWHAGNAKAQKGFIDFAPESNATDALMRMRVSMFDTLHNTDYFPMFPLQVDSRGKLYFGRDDEAYALPAIAALDPTGLTANRNFALPDVSGTLAVTGASQAVSFGTISTGAFLQGTSSEPGLNATSCAGAAIGSGSTNLAGTITGLPGGTCSLVLSFSGAAAPHGWSCSVSDQTTNNLFRTTASTATSITFSGASQSGDVLSYGPCAAY